MADTQLVIFELEGQQYGIEMNCVNCINRIKDFKIMKIPNTPTFIDGVINLRNKIIPMYNLRKKFHFNEDYHNQNSEILIVDIDKVSVGFIVDEVLDIMKFQDENIENAPSIITNLDSRYIKSIAKVESSMIIILDVSYILTQKEKEQIDPIAKKGAV